MLSLFAYGLSATLTPKALELLFSPPHQPLLNYPSKRSPIILYMNIKALRDPDPDPDPAGFTNLDPEPKFGI
jgi:hypothetical protein